MKPSFAIYFAAVAHKDVNVFFFTSDGVAFFKENEAIQHSRNLVAKKQNGTVTKVTRAEYDKYVATTPDGALADALAAQGISKGNLAATQTIYDTDAASLERAKEELSAAEKTENADLVAAATVELEDATAKANESAKALADAKAVADKDAALLEAAQAVVDGIAEAAQDEIDKAKAARLIAVKNKLAKAKKK